jgi:uncharacterized protein (DUF2147 family)
MKSSRLFFALGIALMLAAGAWAAADITGKWTGEMAGRQGQAQEISFNFKVEGEKVTGTMTSREVEAPISDGKLSGDEISFTVVQNTGGNETKSLFKGKVTGDEIKFTRTREGGRGGGQPREFTAKKIK